MGSIDYDELSDVIVVLQIQQDLRRGRMRRSEAALKLEE